MSGGLDAASEEATVAAFGAGIVMRLRRHDLDGQTHHAFLGTLERAHVDDVARHFLIPLVADEDDHAYSHASSCGGCLILPSTAKAVRAATFGPASEPKRRWCWQPGQTLALSRMTALQ